jgi:hypothetical protein
MAHCVQFKGPSGAQFLVGNAEDQPARDKIKGHVDDWATPDATPDENPLAVLIAKDSEEVMALLQRWARETGGAHVQVTFRVSV